MLAWISQHYQMITLLTNVGMLIVWIVYLQVFLGSYNRQRRAKILINRGAGRNLDARCLISNMSAEAIYTESIIASIEVKQDRWSCPVTDIVGLREDEQPTDPMKLTRQGPLLAGAYMQIGTFRDLVNRVLREAGHPTDFNLDTLDDLTAFEIQVIADYGSEDLLVSAKRRFDLTKRDGAWILQPHTLDTEQVRSRRERKRIRRMLENYL